MNKIQPNSFAAACYDDNDIEELCDALAGPADVADMREWNLNVSEWREQIKQALIEKLLDETA